MISWGLSLVGRAPALHAGGQRFDSVSLHHILSWEIIEFSELFKFIKFCDLSRFLDLTKARKIINRLYLSWNKLFKAQNWIEFSSNLLLLGEMKNWELAINWIKRFGIWI